MPIKAITLAVASVIAMEGCSSIPDMGLANQAKMTGDYNTAVAHYSELSNEGYTDATRLLGDTYLQQGSPDASSLAEKSYRKAANDKDLKRRTYAQLRLAKLLTKKENASDAELKEAEILFQLAYKEGEDAVLPLLVQLHMAHPHLWPQANIESIIQEARKRKLPDANLALLVMYKQQGLAESHINQMTELCEQVLKQVPGCYPELTEIYLKTNNNDALDALLSSAHAQYKAKEIKPSMVYRVANMLTKNTFSESRLALADKTYLSIENEYPKALIARIRLRLDNPHFSNAEDTLELLTQAKDQQIPEAELLTGKLYYDGKLVPLKPLIAEQNLLKVSGQFAAADYWLGQIYLKGYIGRPDLPKALEHLLLAARNGSTKADYALAEMYSGGKGVRSNNSYAYLFARLSENPNSEKSTLLISSLEQTISPDEALQSDILLADEIRLRSQTASVNSLNNRAIKTGGFTPEDNYQQFEIEPINYPVTQYGASAQLSYRWDDDQYLGLQSGGKTDELQLNIKPWVKSELNQDWRFFTELQGFTATEVTEIDSDQGGGSSDGFLGVRELWFDYKGITSYPGETLRLGLQRIRERDGLWWDKNIESARWIFDTTTLFAFAGVAQEFYHYRTDENELNDENKNQLNVFSTLSWQWQPGHHIGSRFLYKDNNSDKMDNGTSISQSNSNELARGDFYWLGLNTKSDFFNYRNNDEFNYYAELTWLHFDGENTLISSNGSTATINGYQSETTDNLALDIGLRWKLPVESRIHLGAAMAIGSGGSKGDSQNSFVQTGLQSNRSRFTGTRASFHRFNEAYRAELTNLQAATFYGTLADPGAFDLSMVYHYFQRDDGNANVITDGVNAPLVNSSKDLGHGFDLVTSYYFREITPWVNWRFERDAYVRLRASTFKPGEAYGSDADSMKYRVTMDASFQF